MRVIFFKKEKELLEQIRSGDEKAMERIYNKYRSEFLGWSMDKYNISEDDALDHYQDTVTIFFEKTMNGTLAEIESTIKTYLFGIGKNKIRQKFQSESKEEQHTLGVTEHYQFLGQHSGAQSIFDDASGVAKKVFDSIGQPCKELLRLFYFERKSMTEIAKVLGHKNEGVSRTTKKRCLEKTREQLKNSKAHG